MKEESVNLFFKEGSSDKVYPVSLEKQGSGWVVNFAYGRRGTSLTNGTKTESPLPYADAKLIYDKLIRKQMQKGYTPDKSGTPFTGTIEEKRSVGWIPQLLNEIEEEEVEAYIKNPDFCAQEKYDGRNRLLLMEKGTGPVGANRKGLAIGLDKGLLIEMSIMDTGMVIAGEAMDDSVMCFDIISEKGKSYKERYKALTKLFTDPHLQHLNLVPTAWTENDKRNLYKKLKKNNSEGIVFKNIHAHYTPGRPASGGAQLKFKFCATASVFVTDRNPGKRSVIMGIYDGSSVETVGSVTVYPNQEIPNIGDVIEVKYLYAYKGGSLFQPVLLGVRDDVDQKDCKIEQLKFKKEEETVS